MDFDIYPNPVNSELFVSTSYKPSQEPVLNIKNMLGQIIFTGLNETMEKIFLTNCAR